MVAAAALWTLPVAAATPAARDVPAVRTCSISAYVIDRDPQGLNVRAGPDASAKVLRIVSNDGSGVAEITGQSGAWFRVARVVDAETDSVPFRGDGWIHRSLLAIDVANEDPWLYASPDPRSPVLAKLVADQSRVTLVGCAGKWAKVSVAPRVGWLSPAGQCSNPLTTCA